MATTTQQMINLFEARITELLDEGYSVTTAVKQAYQEYPVMYQLLLDTQAELHAEAERGYGGKLPPSVTKAAFSLPWANDNLTLSDRTTKGKATVQAMVADVIDRQMKKNASYKKLALAVFDGYGKDGVIPAQNVPEFINRLHRLSNGTGYDEKAFNAAIQSVRKQVNKGTTGALKVAYNQLVNAVESRNDEMLSKAVYVATQERTRYFAERIARTEKARAYHDGFIAKYNNDDDIVAYQWKLSSRHPVDDICDLYANADLYGMGKGIFPKDKVPLLPVHPNCMCHLKPIVKGSLENEVPKERIEEGGREYFDSITSHKRERLLGVHGAKAVEAGVSWTQKARGYNTKILESRIKSPKVVELDEVIVKGVTYKVDGKHVLLDHSKHEQQVAYALSDYLQKSIQLVPRVIYPAQIKSPDFIADGVKYELKTPTGNGKHTIYDAIKKGKKQANKFIISIDKTKLEMSAIESQVRIVFNSDRTKNVDEVIVMKNYKVIKHIKK